MERVSFQFIENHLFLNLEGRRYLVDTGAPSSFCVVSALRVSGRSFELAGNYSGMDASRLSEMVGVECKGLLGMDILGRFDFNFEPEVGLVSIHDEEIAIDATTLLCDECMGIPVLEVTIQGRSHRMFFDTGSQLSYLSDEVRMAFPPAGEMTDFFPGMGTFDTTTNMVDMGIGDAGYTLRCGSLPESLEMLLSVADTDGIVGNEIIRGKRWLFAPRRQQLALDCE